MNILYFFFHSANRHAKALREQIYVISLRQKMFKSMTHNYFANSLIVNALKLSPHVLQTDASTSDANLQHPQTILHLSSMSAQLLHVRQKYHLPIVVETTTGLGGAQASIDRNWSDTDHERSEDTLIFSLSATTRPLCALMALHLLHLYVTDQQWRS